jgi:NAD(P)-dependent dehydrogenase (short-subunit alcohol dehydrogenase family)
MRLEGKRILITGTGGGQGRAAQVLFEREGARVIGCDVQPGKAEYTVDLTDADAARRWIDDSAERLGGIDVLYNNAAGYGFSSFAEMDLKLWRHVMHVELDIMFHTTQPVWQHLSKRGGVIINTASLAALRGIAPMGMVAHAAAKGGVIAMTRALAAEGAAHGIRANSISPGFVATPATAATMDKAMQEFVTKMHLIRRPGTVDDVAALALYLASDESAWVTGQDFAIDGGVTAGFR